MPLYEYKCPECNLKFDILRPMSQANSEALCPQCRIASHRLLNTSFACFSKGSDESLPTRLPGTGSACSACSSFACDTCGL